ncbi:MAG: BTAD domain-containing putative transcriptional regulator [Erysipelotrichaceae bacterium]
MSAIEQKTNDLMKINLFNEFVIEYKNEKIIVHEIATRQLMNLLAILIYYRRNPINKSRLIELMWQENENPLNVMKFSIFRLRTLLESIPVLADLDLIITTKNSYEFNPNIPVEIDVEIMSDCWQQMNRSEETNQEYYKSAYKILHLYHGQFLTESNEEWAVQQQNYYSNMYMNVFKHYADYLSNAGKYDELIEISHQAILLDDLNEDAYFYYINGLIQDQQYHKALTTYKEVQKLFFKEFGSPLDLKLRSLHSVIVAKDEEDQIDIESLRQKLNTELNDEGAFYCEYELFRHIYQVELRNLKRDHHQVFLIVFEIHCEGNQKQQQNAMDILKKTISTSLRKGDVFSRMNKVQYLLLIPCLDVENAHFVIHRITSAYYRKVSKMKVKLFYHLSSLLDENETL